ncbi:MAG: hypothetical protein U0174_01105 [Polyangiaceae bacterium]
MDCIEKIGVLSPLLGRSVCALVQVETAAAELLTCSKGKTFRVRAELSWAGWLSLHREVVDDAAHLLDSFAEALEPHHDKVWGAWQRRVLSRELVFESAFPAAMGEDEEDLDKHRIHRQWKSPRVDEVRSSVLERIFASGTKPVALREQLGEHALTISNLQARVRAARRASHAKGNVRELNTVLLRPTLSFLARTFSDIWLLSHGFVRSYPGPKNHAELEREVQATTDAILLGERALALAGSDLRRLAQRRAYYVGIHAAHDAAGPPDKVPFYFNDPEVEQQLAYAAG